MRDTSSMKSIGYKTRKIKRKNYASGPYPTAAVRAKFSGTRVTRRAAQATHAASTAAHFDAAGTRAGFG